MTPAYADNAKSARRGFRLDQETGVLTVKDKLKLKSASEVWWFAHTAAEVELGLDGKSAMLRSNGETVKVEVVVPNGALQPVFTVDPAGPLPSSRVVKGEYPDTGKITRLALRFDGVKDLEFSVVFIPAERTTGTAVPAAEIPLNMEMVSVEEGEVAALLDGDWTTVWSARSYAEVDGDKRYESAFIDIDLEKPVMVSALGLGFDTAFQRRYDLKIKVSNDLKNWEQVFHGHSSKQEGEQLFRFVTQTVRYIRIEGVGDERYQNRYNLLKLYK
jgi:hypothetical protein